MPTLDDYVFEFDGVTFGLGQDIFIPDGGFDPGSADIRSQDTPNPIGDNMMFGRDYLTPPSWAFQFSTDLEDAGSALDALETLASTWQDEKWRDTPSLVGELYYGMPGGRRKLIYGRPRRWQEVFGNALIGGSGAANADFQRADLLHYGEDELSVDIPIIPASTGGWAAPATAPATSVSYGVRSGSVVVGGTVRTWPIFEINAPQGVIAPYVTGPEWAMRLTANGGLIVPDGGQLVIDTRPWARSITLNGGSVAGSLLPGVDFDKMRLPVGTTVLAFGGIDPTGTAVCTVKWRDATRSL